MATNYTPDQTATRTPAAKPGPGLAPVLSLPADGDALNVASVHQDFKALADYIAYIQSKSLSAVFGDGHDGDTALGAGSFAYGAPKYHNDLTLGASTIYNTNGHVVRVRGTLTIASGGILHCNGSDGTGGAGGGTGATGNDGVGYEIFGGSTGGGGGIPGGAAGSPGVDLTSGALGGSGGGGGAGTGVEAAGIGGVATAPTLSSFGGLYSTQPFNPGYLIGRTGAGTWGIQALRGGAGGGGGGAGTAGSRGGGGGGGGGLVIVIAQRVVIAENTAIRALGGAGGAGNTSGGGGGGGGGGGAIILLYGSKSGPALDAAAVAGGAGGAPGSGGTIGTAGSAGAIYEICIG